MPEEEFVTVAEAARALGLSDRQARRRASVLEASGRTRTDGRTRLVTVADMKTVRPDADKRSAPPQRETTEQPQETTGRTPGHDRMTDRTDINDRPDGHGEGPNLHHDQGELIEQLRSEVAFLRAALEREQANTAQALHSAGDAEQRAAQALLIAGRATGQIPAPGLAGDTQSGAGALDGSLPTPEPGKGAPAASWWSRWRRR